MIDFRVYYPDKTLLTDVTHAAHLQALRQIRSSFNTTFVTPEYNCYKTPRGFSTVEPRITAGQPGYVAGVTNRPNRGPKTVGFSPARDHVMCWEVS